MRFRWVRGHVGNHFNERADQLAALRRRTGPRAREERATLAGTDDLAVAPAKRPAAAGRPAAKVGANAVSKAAAEAWTESTLFD
ncbi:hypothetical protein NKG05_10400 [Oerskovia sp. M15]